MRRFLLALLLALSIAPAWAEGDRPELLQALDGAWTMTGDVRGKPVTYTMQAKPVLHGRFTEMRMRDVQTPSQYEAHVYLGVDPGTGSLIVHWMDSFGAKYSIPHATGRIDGDTMQFSFAYASGQFRDTFSYDREARAWTFVLEAQQPDGSWKHFAKYRVLKATAP